MNKDLIIAAAIGYKFHHIEMFLVSLHKKFNGTLLLLTDKEYRKKLYSFKLIIGKIHSNYYESALPLKLNSPNNSRLFYSQKFVIDHPDYERILMTDIRDVVFQEDPFFSIIDDKVQVAIEDVRIGENEYNAFWVKVLMGEEYLEKVKNEWVSCSGTILGNRKVMLNYLTFITEMISDKGRILDTGDNYFIIDQGAHNIFCIEFPDMIHKHNNTTGKIFTMSYPNRIILSRSGEFINNQGVLYSIVHQYDRYDFLNKMLRIRYELFTFSDLKSFIKKYFLRYTKIC
jgi:hypothetical protein